MLNLPWIWTGRYTRPIIPLSPRMNFDLCSIETEQAAYSEAETHCRIGVSIDQSWYGPANPITASAMKTLAELLLIENKNREAKILLERVLAIQEESHGSVHHTVASALNEIGYVAEKSGQYSEAEQDYQRGLEIFRKLYGDHHFYVATALSNLATLAYKRGNDFQAETLICQALTIYIEAQGPGHMNTGIAHIKLGHFLLGEKKYAAARSETVLGSNILVKQTRPREQFSADVAERSD